MLDTSRFQFRKKAARSGLADKQPSSDFGSGELSLELEQGTLREFEEVLVKHVQSIPLIRFPFQQSSKLVEPLPGLSRAAPIASSEAEDFPLSCDKPPELKFVGSVGGD